MKNPAKIGLSCQGKGKYGWLLRHISDVRFLHTLTPEADMERVILTPDDLGEILDWADDTPARIEAAGGNIMDLLFRHMDGDLGDGWYELDGRRGHC